MGSHNVHNGNREKIKRIDPAHPQPDIIEKAVKVLKTNGLVCYPTMRLYGLGADAMKAEAVDKVFAAKNRLTTHPVSVLVDSVKTVETLVRRITPVARILIDRFWPGNLTIVFEANDTVPGNLTAGTGKIGIRIPEHPVAVALLRLFKGPVTATSANLTGQPACRRCDEIDPVLLDRIDLVLDAGELEGGKGSTVVEAVSHEVKIIREGAVSENEIRAALDGR